MTQSLFRRSVRRLCAASPSSSTPPKPAAAAAATGASTAAARASKPAAAPESVGVRNTRNAINMRKSPKALYTTEMHSYMLSDHPSTLRAEREEVAFRQRMLEERGEWAEAEQLADKLDAEDTKGGAAGTGANDYWWSLGAATAGYLTAHVVVFNYFHAEEVRLPYDPVQGFTEDLRAKRREQEAMERDMAVMVGKQIAPKVQKNGKPSKQQASLITADG
jgi:hypothetical protein